MMRLVRRLHLQSHSLDSTSPFQHSMIYFFQKVLKIIVTVHMVIDNQKNVSYDKQ